MYPLHSPIHKFHSISLHRNFSWIFSGLPRWQLRIAAPSPCWGARGASPAIFSFDSSVFSIGITRDYQLLWNIWMLVEFFHLFKYFAASPPITLSMEYHQQELRGLGPVGILCWVTESFRFCTLCTAWRVKIKEGKKKVERKALSKAEWRWMCIFLSFVCHWK